MLLGSLFMNSSIIKGSTHNIQFCIYWSLFQQASPVRRDFEHDLATSLGSSPHTESMGASLQQASPAVLMQRLQTPKAEQSLLLWWGWLVGGFWWVFCCFPRLHFRALHFLRSGRHGLPVLPSNRNIAGQQPSLLSPQSLLFCFA